MCGRLCKNVIELWHALRGSRVDTLELENILNCLRWWRHEATAVVEDPSQKLSFSGFARCGQCQMFETFADLLNRTVPVDQPSAFSVISATLSACSGKSYLDA